MKKFDPVIVGGGLTAPRAIKEFRAAFYLDRGRLVGTLHTGQDEETEDILKRPIRAGSPPLPLITTGGSA